MTTSKPDEFLQSINRGRNDIEFFWKVFLGRTPNAAQLEYCEQANATVNCLATSNRWGKTTLIPARHFHGQLYKIGGEHRYLDDKGAVIPEQFMRLKYRTIHVAKEWGLARLVWDEAQKLIRENPLLATFFPHVKKSDPPHLESIFRGRWKFNTLGHNAAGIDGDSFYLISIDEAGWIEALETMMNNVIRIRVADVRGRIDLVGTFKPGVSRDFYKECVRAAAHTGRSIVFDHRDVVEEDVRVGGIHPAILKLLLETGIPLDELEDAATRGAV